LTTLAVTALAAMPASTENAYSKLPAAIAYGHINFRLANLSSLPSRERMLPEFGDQPVKLIIVIAISYAGGSGPSSSAMHVCGHSHI